MQIPERLRQKGIRFVLLEKSGKKPFQQAWQNKIIEYDDVELENHIGLGGNYGVMGGGDKKLILVDFDNEKIERELVPKLPETFTVKTGSGRLHLYFFSDKCESFKIFDEEMNTLADIQGDGKQVVGAESIHPNGNKYELIKDIDIAYIDYAELKAMLMAYDKKPRPKNEGVKKVYVGLNDETNFVDVVKSKIPLESVLSCFGVDISKNPTNCPLHSSKGGKCLGFNSETWHCFHCEESGNIFSLVMKHNNCDFKNALLWIAKEYSLEDEYEECKRNYIERLKQESKKEDKEVKYQFLNLVSGKNKDWAEASELLRNYVINKIRIFTTKDDKNSEMWVYKDGVYIPQGRSEVRQVLRELLEEQYSNYIYNKVIEKIEPDTFIEADKFFNINYKEEIPVFNGILNIKTLELSDFDEEKIFFNKLPVKYNIEATCPKIEEFLKSVLSCEEDINVFYEMAGFSLLKEYIYEKAFMFVGGGRNGKGKSIELLKRLLGVENCSAVPLSLLVPDSFSISELFGKFINVAADIGNQDLKDSSTFKSLTGRDLISGKVKFQRDRHFENYAKLIFACNELPMVYDLTRAFWDRWILLEFPYTFVTQEEYNQSEDKSLLKIKDDNIISKISTPEEMSGFLNQALAGLHRLIKNKRFSATKGTEEVKATWIRKSNSFIAFCYDFLEDSSEGWISKKELRKKYSEFCKEHQIPSKSDFVIKKSMQDLFGALEERKESVPGYWDWVWIGVKWKN